MKYLKPFNESVEFEDFLRDLRDICLELTDNGFTIRGIDLPFTDPQFWYVLKFKSSQSPNPMQFRVDIRKQDKGSFNINDVYDTLKRIEDFCRERNFEFDIVVTDGSMKFFSKSIDYLINHIQGAKPIGVIRHIKLTFKPI